MMEIQMPQGAHMVDLETAHFKPFQAVARGKGAGGGAFRLRLAEHSLCFEIAPDRGVGGNRGIAPFKCCAEVVEMELSGPARMLAILGSQRLDNEGCQTGEAADVAAQAILQGPPRIVGPACPAEQPFQRKDAETEIQAGHRVTPSLGRKLYQFG